VRDHLKQKAEKSSEAESFRDMKIKNYPTHLKMAMQAETCRERQ
jgi:hypothetical protein